MHLSVLSTFTIVSAVLARPTLHHTQTHSRHPYLPTTRGPSIHARSATAAITAADVLAIAPSSSSCADALYPAECRTAAQAAPHISAGLARYNITHPSVRAALLSLMAYESGEFKYNRNHFPPPGVPGQGTRNMQSAGFNAAYARDLGFGAAVWGGGAAVLMGAVGRDEYSFASAAWFVATQCALEVRTAMWGGSRAAWERYLTGCVGATLDEGRVGYWERAMSVLGGKRQGSI